MRKSNYYVSLNDGKGGIKPVKIPGYVFEMDGRQLGLSNIDPRTGEPRRGVWTVTDILSGMALTGPYSSRKKFFEDEDTPRVMETLKKHAAGDMMKKHIENFNKAVEEAEKQATDDTSDTGNQNTNDTEKTIKKEGENMEKVNYFEGVSTLDDLRNVYRDLLKKNHPDNGGSEDATKEINAQYTKAFEDLKKGVDLTDKKTAIKWDDAEDAAIREALYKIIHLKNINIEVVGSWIWVDGDTFTGRDTLKTAGYKWSRNRKKWHFAPYEKKYYKGGKMKFDEIRARYGSKEVETENREELTA